MSQVEQFRTYLKERQDEETRYRMARAELDRKHFERMVDIERKLLEGAP